MEITLEFSSSSFFSPKKKDDNPGQFAAPLDQGELLLTFGVLIIPQGSV